jgi:hypothetical protein
MMMMLAMAAGGLRVSVVRVPGRINGYMLYARHVACELRSSMQFIDPVASAS